MIENKTKQELIEKAINARQMSYAPYSKFAVGAALLTASGRIYTGCNVENASYGAGICAERTAAVKAISEGDAEFTAIAIAGYHKNASPEARGLAYPCGICRQFLNEFRDEDIQVFVAKAADDYVETTLNELLPQAFGPKDLDR